MTDLTASIVLYQNSAEQIHKAIAGVLDSGLPLRLTLVDNSPDDRLRALSDVDSRVQYIFNNCNIGFGAGHNIALRAALAGGSEFHLVLNPDAWFAPDVLPQLLDYMSERPDIGNLMPRVRFGDGTDQPLGKLLPTPLNVISRRLLPEPLRRAFGINTNYELRFWSARQTANLPCLSGCFMLLRTRTLREIGLFDENMFMYFEDFDLNRRIHERYQTVYYPHQCIFHDYTRGSSRSQKLLLIHIRSALYYFNKWGWMIDRQRRTVNRQAIQTLRALDSGDQHQSQASGAGKEQT